MTSDDRNSPLVPEATGVPGPGSHYGTFDENRAALLETGIDNDVTPGKSTAGNVNGVALVNGHGKDVEDSVHYSEFTWLQCAYLGSIISKCTIMGAVQAAQRVEGGASCIPYAVGLGLTLQAFPWEGHFTWDGFMRAKKASPPKFERIHFLDNLKVFVLQVVVAYKALFGYAGCPNHIAESLGASPGAFRRFAFAVIWISQCFEPLFFFVSGYFAPQALESLGPADFVRNRLHRYGKPLVAYFVGLSLWGWFFSLLVVGRETRTFVGSPGLAWVLEVLIVFNLIYAVFPSPAISSPFPSPWRVCLAGLVLGLLQGLFVKETFTFENIPIQPSSLPFYLTFFIAGVVARRSGWLAEIRNLSPGQLAFAFATTVACALCLAVLVVPLADSVAHLEDREGQLTGYYLPWDQTLAMHALAGVLTMASSMVLLNFFARYLDFTNGLLTLLSQGAFGVLIFFTVTLMPAQYTYELILSGNGVDLTFEKLRGGEWVSKTPLEPRLLFLGWLYSTTITSAILYPLCYNTIKMPGVRVAFS